jgi:hypothetical protein
VSGQFSSGGKCTVGNADCTKEAAPPSNPSCPAQTCRPPRSRPRMCSSERADQALYRAKSLGRDRVEDSVA